MEPKIDDVETPHNSKSKVMMADAKVDAREVQYLKESEDESPKLQGIKAKNLEELMHSVIEFAESLDFIEQEKGGKNSKPSSSKKEYIVVSSSLAHNEKKVKQGDIMIENTERETQESDVVNRHVGSELEAKEAQLTLFDDRSPKMTESEMEILDTEELEPAVAIAASLDLRDEEVKMMCDVEPTSSKDMVEDLPVTSSQACNEEEAKRGENRDGILKNKEIAQQASKAVDSDAEPLLAEAEAFGAVDVDLCLTDDEMEFESSVSTTRPVSVTESRALDAKSAKKGTELQEMCVETEQESILMRRLLDGSASSVREEEPIVSSIHTRRSEPPIIDLEDDGMDELERPVFESPIDNTRLLVPTFVDMERIESGDNSESSHQSECEVTFINVGDSHRSGSELSFIDVDDDGIREIRSLVVDDEGGDMRDSESSIVDVETIDTRDFEFPVIACLKGNDFPVVDMKMRKTTFVPNPIRSISLAREKAVLKNDSGVEVCGEQSSSGIKTTTTDGKDQPEVPVSEISSQCPLCFKTGPREYNLLHLLWHFLVKNGDGKSSKKVLKKLDTIRREDYETGLDILDEGCDSQNLPFEILLNIYKAKLLSTSGLDCMQCQENFEVHYNPAELMKVVQISSPLTCIVCNKTFTDRLSLQIHRKQHLGTKPYGCCCCSEVVFDDVADLKIHMKVHTLHPYWKLFKCKHCLRVCFTENDLGSHLLEHERYSRVKEHSSNGEERNDTGVERTLDRALVNVSVDRFFDSGYSSNLESREKISNCKNAVEVVEEISRFRKRERDVCNEKDLLQGELGALLTILKSVNQTMELTKLLQENQSPLNYVSDSLDVVKDLEDQLGVYNQVLSSSYGSILGNLDKTKIWCNYCCESFSDNDALQMHKYELHEGPKIFSCEMCAARFGSLNSLMQHRSMHITGEKHKCPICSQNFDFRFDKTHHLKVHFADKLKRCPECGLDCKLQSQLTNHLGTHAEIKPFLYECRECRDVFSGDVPLSKHVQRVHAVKRPHECFICKKKFFKQNSWVLHVKGHIRNKFRKSLIGMDMYKPRKWSHKKIPLRKLP